MRASSADAEKTAAPAFPLTRHRRARSSTVLGKRENHHGNGLREFLLEVPAGRIAAVGKEGVDALGGLLRLQRVDAVFGFVAFFADGEDSKGSYRLEGVAGFCVQHAHTQRNVVACIDERERCN